MQCAYHACFRIGRSVYKLDVQNDNDVQNCTNDALPQILFSGQDLCAEAEKVAKTAKSGEVSTYATYMPPGALARGASHTAGAPFERMGKSRWHVGRVRTHFPTFGCFRHFFSLRTTSAGSGLFGRTRTPRGRM